MPATALNLFWIFPKLRAPTVLFEVADPAEISKRMHNEVFVTQVEATTFA